MGEVPVSLLSQGGDQRPSQAAITHIGQSFGIDHIVGVPGAQQVEEVEPALAGRGAKPGEMRVADLGAHAVARLVPCAGVIDADPGRIRQTRTQHVAGFVAEGVLACDQQAHDLALGHVGADGTQLCQQACHRHLPLVVLDKDEAAQFGSEVARSPGWKRRRDSLPVRRPAAFAAVAGDVRAQHQVLHHEALVALEV